MLESSTTNQESKTDLIDLSGLWENTTKNGEKYLTGNMGGARILIFKNNYKGDNPKAPDYKLFLTKRQFHEDRMDESAAAVAPSQPAAPARPAAVPKQEDDIPF